MISESIQTKRSVEHNMYDLSFTKDKGQRSSGRKHRGRTEDTAPDRQHPLGRVGTQNGCSGMSIRG